MTDSGLSVQLDPSDFRFFHLIQETEEEERGKKEDHFIPVSPLATPAVYIELKPQTTQTETRTEAKKEEAKESKRETPTGNSDPEKEKGKEKEKERDRERK